MNTYDEKCYRLAEDFLIDVDGMKNATKRHPHADKLAAEIQLVIEDYIIDLERQLERERSGT